MAALQEVGPDLLGWWIERGGRRGGTRTRTPSPAEAGIAFAFYGRISTEDNQDRQSSGRWQRDFAEDLIDGRGRIVADFFDIGFSRERAWSARPQAQALLVQLRDATRTWEAIVVGESERAFTYAQFEAIQPVFAACGVPIWLPELNGPVDVEDEMHVALLKLLGVHSRREIQRARFRAKASMRAQVVVRGRQLGGRPPYGYMLVDAGPHPNKAHARWGRRLQRLEPDPISAPTVRWILARRLEGWSVAHVARDLNERNIPCPSQADPLRNPHRTGEAWIVQTVAAILANPRYTGRQVWNRQCTDVGPLDGADDLLGRSEARRWNALQGWVISADVVHPPLVCEADFIAAQAVRTAPTPADGSVRVFLVHWHRRVWIL